jgi:hypothetical protein
LIEVKPRVVGCDEREVRCDSEDVAQRPSFKKIERDIGVELEERLERYQALFELFVGIPVRLVLETRFGPAIEKVLHGIHGASDAVIGDVYCVI